MHSVSRIPARKAIRFPDSFWHAVFRLFSLRRQRRDLATLDDHMLRDVGLTRQDAQRESGRPIWDVPAHWHR